jgi:acyl-CoA reductase-like NAD-dependent aldehyde dehydrogenase
MNLMDQDLLSIQEGRILAESARAAQTRLATFSQRELDEIVDHMAEEMKAHIYELAVLSCEETEYGIWQDKYIKNKFICDYLPQKLKGMCCVGIIHEDPQNQTMDIGVPRGVILALPPATSPVSTTIYQAIIAIKSGNSLIVSPHPRAKKTIGKALDILIEIGEQYGLPEGALSYLHCVTRSGTQELMNASSISLVINTGVPGMLKDAADSGKPLIYGGTGNGPAFIERTADITQAVKDIVTSKTFDHGVVSAAEQSVVVDGCIAQKIKHEFQNQGAYFMNEEESQKLGALFYLPDGSIDPELVGKSAQELAKRAGFHLPDHVRLLISEQKYVDEKNPYSREKLCPVLAYYIEDDWMHACEKCIELLLSEKTGHTLVIHSKDEDVIRQFALKKPVGRVLVNTPAVFGSMGMTTNLFPAMTLGSGSAKIGITADNVSPMNLIYIRKVGYGVKKAEEIITENKPDACCAKQPPKDEQQEIKTLERFLEQVMERLT